MSETKTIIVLGMHAGGTSAAAGMLKILGVNMGERLVGESIVNVRGHFEDAAFLAVNEKILASLGKTWKDIPPDAGAVEAAARSVRSDIKALTKEKTGTWGWKDPRTAVTVGAFLPFIKNPHFVAVFRNPHEIARSLKERGDLETADGLRLAAAYYSRIAEFIGDNPAFPFLFVSFEDILLRPEEEVRKMARFLGFELSETAREEIRNFIIPAGAMSELKEEAHRRRVEELAGKIREMELALGVRGWRTLSFIRKLKKSIPFVGKL